MHNQKTMMWVLVALLVLGLSACGGGGGNADESQPLLAGDASALAVNALSATGPMAAEPADRSGNLLLTRVEVALAAAATVGQFNAAATAVEATGISFSEAGSPFVTLIVPRQASGAALMALVERLRAQPGIVFATPAWQLSAFWLPGEGTGNAHDPELLGHLLPARFPAAWNASFSETGQRLRTTRNCTPAEATVIVADLFESLPAGAGSQYDAFAGAQRFGRFDAGGYLHGWRVAATLAASFDDQRPTGATPLTDCVDFVLVDLSGLSYRQAVVLVKRAIDAQPAFAPLIVNLSVGFVANFCGPNGDSACTQLAVDAAPTSFLEMQMWNRVMAAIDWATMTSATLDQRLLLVQAAGNEAAFLPENGGLGLLFPGIRQADLSSPWALATRLDSLDQLFAPDAVVAQGLWTGTPVHSLLLSPASYQFLASHAQQQVTRVPDLSNLLLVGAATHGVLPEQVSEWPASNEGSALLAVGEQVVVLDGLIDGTSFAAPQVSGLAAYLWTLSELEENNHSTSETARLIKATVTPGSLIDAYAATLALDVVLPHFGPDIRQALLDVTGDDLFNEEDLFRFEAAYGLDDPNTPSIPESRNYGRFDLNGDGATGGIPTAVFDLDRNQLTPGGTPVINTVDRDIEGYPVTFNEAALSDIQILCYYAYSTLYADGSPTPAQEQARTAILGPDHCVGARLNTLFPAQVSGSATLDVTVEVPAGGGQYAPAPNMLVTFTPTCGSVSPTSGRTGAEGNLSTTVTPTGCSSSVSVTAVARADEGTTVLAQKTVTAALGSGSVLQDVLIRTGQPAGTIEAILTDSNGADSMISGPIGQAADLMAQVNVALSSVSEVSRNVQFAFWEPVSVTLSAAGLKVSGDVYVWGDATACASIVNVTLGDVQQSVLVGGCLDRATLALGDIGRAIEIYGTNTDVNVSAGAVAERIVIGSSMQAVNAMSIDVQMRTSNSLYINNSRNSSVRIQGSIEKTPSHSNATLTISGNSNLTLAPLTGGTLYNFTIETTSFASPPAITVGNIVHPGGGVTNPNGSVRIVGSSGLSLGSFGMGNIEGDLRIQDNRGFSNTDATNFAEARTVGGATIISGNQP
jgi:hypothetical protein